MFKFTTNKMEWLSSKSWLLAGGLLVGLAAVPFIIPDAAYKSLIEKKLSNDTGLKAEIKGDFSISLLPTLRVEADQIAFEGPLAQNVDLVGEIGLVLYEMDLLEFLQGQIYINEFIIQSPQFSINGDFANDIPNWIQNNLSIRSKNKVRYQEILFGLMQRTAFRYTEITDGTLNWNKSNSETLNIDKIRLTMEKPKAGQDLIIEGDAYLNDRSIDLDLKLERPDNFLRGYRSELAFHIDSNPFRLSFEGSAAHRRNFVAQGALDLNVPSLYEYCRWMHHAQNCIPSAKGMELDGLVRFRDEQLQIENATLLKEDFRITGDGAIDFKPTIPMISANILTPEQELNDLLDGLIVLEDYDFNSLLVDAYDANLSLKTNGIQLGANEMITPELKVIVKDGRLNLNLDDVDMFGGNSNFRFRWNKGLEEGYMDLRFDTAGIDLMRMQRALGQNFETNGTLKSSFEIQSLGASVRSLMETARIYGEFSILDGVFFNEDVASSLGDESATSFEFAELKGRVNGDRGEVKSTDIRLVAPNVIVNGAGHFDFINNELKVQLRSQTNEQIAKIGQGENPKGFVEISGSLNRLGLVTSMTAENQQEFTPFDGLNSGLLPITDDTLDNELQEDFFINESDLLD